MTATEPLVLGIESSCDETGIGIVRGSKLLTNTISSSMEEHVRFGGVIPEIASRAHLEAMLPALEKALTEAGVNLSDIDAIAVTAGPGLAGALMVGVAAAKALAVATGKPLYGINHLVAHVGVGLLDDNGTSDGVRLLQNAEAGGLGALLVSGGHTEILQVRDITSDVRLLGATLDDAAGEAFDKIARVMGYPYPGGPQIDKLAALGNADAVVFPKALHERNNFEFSFSGLKSAVLNYLHTQEQRGETYSPEDVAASFQKTVVETLVEKTVNAAELSGLRTVVLAGGVAATHGLTQAMETACKEKGYTFYKPEPILCTDNGAMIGCRAYYMAQDGRFADMTLNAKPALSLTGTET